MVSTGGSQHFIGNSTPQTIDIRDSFPQSYFTLRINSNDLYSREKYPNNNCHIFSVDFPQGTAESIQSRISQCHRFQIIDLKTSVRNHKGILTDKAVITEPPFYSPVLKSSALLTPVTPAGTLRSKLGLLTLNQYQETHEELEYLHLLIECQSMRIQEMENESNFLYRLLPLQRFISKTKKQNNIIYETVVLYCILIQDNMHLS